MRLAYLSAPAAARTGPLTHDRAVLRRDAASRLQLEATTTCRRKRGNERINDQSALLLSLPLAVAPSRTRLAWLLQSTQLFTRTLRRSQSQGAPYGLTMMGPMGL